MGRLSSKKIFPLNETGDLRTTPTTTVKTTTTPAIPMAFKVIRVRDLELRTYCPPSTMTTTKRSGRPYSAYYDPNRTSTCRLCPSCFLPVVVAFILIFSVSQLIVIHRTIEAYKLRNQAYEDCFSGAIKSSVPNSNSPSLADLGLSKNFSPMWPNSTQTVDWSNDQVYPYRLPVKHPIDHTWKSICPPISPLLQGNLSIDPGIEFSIDEIIAKNPKVESGGKWNPQCGPQFRLAIVIPYRARWNHFKTLLSVLHPMLQRQLHSYRIFLVEQYGNYTFNKGIIMNAAFILAMNISSFDCVIFHDVDLIPEDDRNIYSCESMPRHLSVAIDTLNYKLPYPSLVGGVFSLRIEDFVTVNGYSNLYWGWGAEDDDMFNRLMANKLLITRPSKTVARYKMLQHGRRLPNQFINPLIRTARIRFRTDGLTTCKFRLISAKLEPLFTHFIVDIGEPSINFSPGNHQKIGNDEFISTTDQSSNSDSNVIEISRNTNSHSEPTSESKEEIIELSDQ